MQLKNIFALFLSLLFFSVQTPVCAEDSNNVNENIAKWWAEKLAEAQASNQKYLEELVANEENIVGIEVIIAAGSDNEAYSKWGHAMLRFIDNDKDFSNDLVLSLAAWVNTPVLDKWKGLKGDYPMSVSIRPLGEFWKEYLTGEKRPLNRFIIPTNNKLRKNLISTIQNWATTEEGKKELGSYTFLSNNCAGALSHLLAKSGFPTNFFQAKIPTHFEGWLNKSLLSPFQKLTVGNNVALINELKTVLNIQEEDLYRGVNWPADSFNIINDHFNDLQIKKIMLEIPRMPGFVMRPLVKIHNYRNGGARLEDVENFTYVPSELYEICDTAACALTHLELEAKVWSKDEVTLAKKSRIKVYRNFLVVNRDPLDDGEFQTYVTYDEDLHYLPRNLLREPSVLQNFQLLLKAQQ